MASESVFKDCNKCNKQISKTATICPHCGEKNKKLSFLQWIGIAFLSFFALMFLDGFMNASNIIEPSTNMKHNVSPKQGSRIDLPEDQLKFIGVVGKYANGFGKAKNELQQSALRDQRQNEISKIMTDRRVYSWIGEISKLQTNTDGDAIISIKVSPDIEIKTWNNAFSDINSSTLISKGSELYNSLLNLSRGQKVRFSGSFFSSQEDHFEETSVTIKGSMRNPEFLFKFSSIKPLN